MYTSFLPAVLPAKRVVVLLAVKKFIFFIWFSLSNFYVFQLIFIFTRIQIPAFKIFVVVRAGPGDFLFKLRGDSYAAIHSAALND